MKIITKRHSDELFTRFANKSSRIFLVPIFSLILLLARSFARTINKTLNYTELAESERDFPIFVSRIFSVSIFF